GSGMPAAAVRRGEGSLSRSARRREARPQLQWTRSRGTGGGMAYCRDSIEGRLQASDPEAVGTVFRWIAVVLTSPRFRCLQCDWLDLHQEAMARVLGSLRKENFEAGRDFRAYVQGIARHTARQALFGLVRTSPLPDEDPLPDARTENGEDDVARLLLARRVLDGASDGCRELMCMYFFERLSY